MTLSRSDLIELKVLNKLSESQEAEFDNLLDSDPTFAKEFVMVQDFAAYVTNDKVIDFREKLDSLHKDFITEKSRSKVRFLNNNTWRLIASVAAVLVIALGSYFTWNQNSSADNLYKQYYQTDEIFLNTRSGNSEITDILEQGLILFENDKYEESINYFQQLPKSITATYYSGVAHMELGEYDVATYKFDQVIDDYLNVFYDQAKWYKGLCLVKQDKRKDASIILLDISKSNSYYKQQATELLKELN